MCNPQTLNTIGLLLAMVGVTIIFKFGPPQPSFEEGISLGLGDANILDSSGKTVADHDREMVKKRKLYSVMSSIGLFLIFIGFAFQLWAIWAN